MAQSPHKIQARGRWAIRRARERAAELDCNIELAADESVLSPGQPVRDDDGRVVGRRIRHT